MGTINKQPTITCIIDDDDIYLFSVKKVIEINKLSDQVLQFKNGNEAITFFREYSSNAEVLPDFIFLDINMPVMNGWEFIDEFKKIKPLISKNIILYLVSSSVDETDMGKAKSLPVVHDYLTKPMTASKLKNIYEVA